MYNLTYSKEALKQLKKLDMQTRGRIISALERSRIRPHSFVKKLVSSQYFRLRVGDYRVIVNIIQGEMRILVVEVGYRKNIYK